MEKTKTTKEITLIKKIERTEKLFKAFERARNIVELEDYLHTHVARFRCSELHDSQVNAFYQGVDEVIVRCINVALELDNYYETFGTLKVESGFITDRLYECVNDSGDFYIFLGRLNNIVDEINKAEIVIEELEV
jgi:hypothetical protein